MPRFVDIDLADLPAPDALEALDFEALLAARKAELLARIDDEDLRAEIAAVMGLESEPLNKLSQSAAYRETLVRGRINDAVRAVLLPTSKGADLDNICSRLGVERMVIEEDLDADPPVERYVEIDDRLRDRYQLALEAFSTCGPWGAYKFHALSASLDVLDCGVYGPEEDFVDLGHVHLVVLSRLGDGTPDQALLDAVDAKCSADDARPLADFVEVYAATIETYAVTVHLEIRRGADPARVVAEAEEKLAAYAGETHKVGAIVALSGLYDAAHSPNVIRATLSSPAAEVDPGAVGAPHCSGITVTYEVIDV